MIPNEHGWYIARYKVYEGFHWTCVAVRQIDRYGKLGVDSTMGMNLEDWEFHSKIDLPQD